MTESFLIAVREGFEAALVVSIVLAYARRAGDHAARRWVWTGTAAAVALATVVGVVLHLTIDGLVGTTRARTFAAICATAAALLTWMIFWMATNGRRLKSHLEDRTAGALARRSGLALAGVAFAAVIREGLETALFLLSTTSSSGGATVAAGTVLGLAVAVGLGVLVYRGSERIQVRRFFQLTGAVIILFAAGLVARTVMFLQNAGDLGTVKDAVFDLTSVRLLTGETQFGRFLAGIFGWDPKPSLEQVVAYLGYLVPVALGYARITRRPLRRPAPVPSAPLGASAA